MASIRSTLLRSLFLDTPPFMGEALEEHADRVFPGRHDFIQFLEEVDAQKRTKIAKRLLTRLARESGLFIPSSLLVGLLRAEEQYAPATATTQYVPQDHFSHLIQLYLLGIYLFTHHKKLHRRLSSFFKRKREEDTSTCSLSSDDTAFIDFIFAWRSFVLLHDIGYPCELPLIEKNILLAEIRKEYLKIPNLIYEEAALAFLSRVLTWEQLDEQFPRPVCKSVAPDLFQPASRRRGGSGILPGFAEMMSGPCISAWENAERIPTLHGRRFASIVYQICDRADIVALLVHRRSGEVALALIPDSHGYHQMLDLNSRIKLTAHDLRKYAFDYGTTPRGSTKHPEYEWQMFLSDYIGRKKSLIKELAALVNKYFSIELLKSVSSDLSRKAPNPLTTITSDSDYRAYEFWIYETLRDWRQGLNQSPATTATIEHNVVLDCAKSMEGNIARHISEFIKELIDSQIAKNSRDEGGELLGIGIKKIVEKAIEPVIKNDDLCKNLADYVEVQLHSSIESELCRRRLFDDTQALSRLQYGEVLMNATDEAEEQNKGLAELFAGALVQMEDEVKALDHALELSTLPLFSELLAHYRPTFLTKGSIDHGLASAFCSLQITNCSRALINRLTTKSTVAGERALKAFAGIAICLGDENDSVDIGYRTKSLMTEVTRAIAIHNLYPKHLEALHCESFRVNLQREPFCFFVMLADALQSWDRDRRLWQSENTLQYKTSGEHYDIEISGDVIHVHEHDYGLDVVKRAESLKKGLEGYLYGVKDYLWVDLAEWPERSHRHTLANMRDSRQGARGGDL